MTKSYFMLTLFLLFAAMSIGLSLPFSGGSEASQQLATATPANAASENRATRAQDDTLFSQVRGRQLVENASTGGPSESASPLSRFRNESYPVADISLDRSPRSDNSTAGSADLYPGNKDSEVSIDIQIQLMRWQRFIDGTLLSPEVTQLVALLLKNAELSNASLYRQVLTGALGKRDFEAQRAVLITQTKTDLADWLSAEELAEFQQLWQDNSASYPEMISTRLKYSIPESDSKLFELAVSEDNAELVNYLMNDSVNVNAIDPRNGSNALIKASYAGRTDNVVTLLRHGAQSNSRTRFGRTALLNATSNGHVGTVAVLLLAGADAKLTDSVGISPLSAADLYRSQGENYETIADMLAAAILEQHRSALDPLISKR